MNDYQLYIDSEFCESSDGGRFDTVNPATGEVWASAPAATEADVDRAVRAARRALVEGEWPTLTATQRGRLLSRRCIRQVVPGVSLVSVKPAMGVC